MTRWGNALEERWEKIIQFFMGLRLLQNVSKTATLRYNVLLTWEIQDSRVHHG